MIFALKLGHYATLTKTFSDKIFSRGQLIVFSFFVAMMDYLDIIKNETRRTIAFIYYYSGLQRSQFYR